MRQGKREEIMPEDPNEPFALLSNEEAATVPEATPVERLIAQEIESKPEAPSFIIRPPRRKPGTLLIFTGLVLPSVAILIEITSAICAPLCFDSLPSVWHNVRVIAVPLANMLVIRGLWWSDAEYHWRLGLANGLAVAVSTFYPIIYLPLTPLALLALSFAGLGLLGLAPVLCLIASALCLRQLRMLAREGGEFYGSARKPVRGCGFGMSAGGVNFDRHGSSCDRQARLDVEGRLGFTSGKRARNQSAATVRAREDIAGRLRLATRIRQSDRRLLQFQLST